MQNIIEVLSELGNQLRNPSSDFNLQNAIRVAEQENPWFTKAFITDTLTHWGSILTKENLETFVS
ncbi:MAG: hypothetical protein MI739_07255, partial [Bacteroidales bacterium]|nr:hypothetical protein [Bacteroidales bacterium]